MRRRSPRDATIQLFREEYKVPVLPPQLAAQMALGLSSLVLVGLFSLDYLPARMLFGPASLRSPAWR